MVRSDSPFRSRQLTVAVRHARLPVRAHFLAGARVVVLQLWPRQICAPVKLPRARLRCRGHHAHHAIARRGGGGAARHASFSEPLDRGVAWHVGQDVAARFGAAVEEVEGWGGQVGVERVTRRARAAGHVLVPTEGRGRGAEGQRCRVAEGEQRRVGLIQRASPSPSQQYHATVSTITAAAAGAATCMGTAAHLNSGKREESIISTCVSSCMTTCTGSSMSPAAYMSLRASGHTLIWPNTGLQRRGLAVAGAAAWQLG